MDSDPRDPIGVAAAGQAMLFCPPQPPVRIDPPGVVLGRHHSCDLALRCEDVSRRHAEVRSCNGQFEVEDLSSTNGTFLNGEKLTGKHPLLPGDRIEIGSRLVTFCYIEASMDGDGSVTDARQTMLKLDAPSDGEAFRGALSEIPPFALLQVMEMGSKTGVLQFEGGNAAGRIWFQQGTLVHAETDKQLGFDAAMQLVADNQGRFRFEPGDVEVEHTIRASVTELLLEACRQADEASIDYDPGASA